MPSPLRFPPVKSKFDKLCTEHRYTRSGYYRVARVVAGKKCGYSIPLVSGRQVKPRHVALARHALHITDAEWDAA